MEIAYLIAAVASVAAVILFALRKQDASRAATAQARADRLEKELSEVKSDTSGRKDTLESRTKELTELREKLRDAKKRLHEEKETHRKVEIDQARAQAERDAQNAIDTARREASEAQAELARLKRQLETSGKGQRERRPEPVAAAPAEVAVDLTAPTAPSTPRPPRELTQIEQDRITVLEKQAVKQAERVKQLEADVSRAQRRAETQNKVFLVARSEAELSKSKVSLVEKRLNRTLLELDKLKQVAFKAGLVKEIKAAQEAADSETAAKDKAEGGAVASAPEVGSQPQAKA